MGLYGNGHLLQKEASLMMSKGCIALVYILSYSCHYRHVIIKAKATAYCKCIFQIEGRCQVDNISGALGSDIPGAYILIVPSPYTFIFIITCVKHD